MNRARVRLLDATRRWPAGDALVDYAGRLVCSTCRATTPDCPCPTGPTLRSPR